MLVYDVSATVAPELAPRFEAYMRDRHVPALLETGCFVAATISRSAPGAYRLSYLTPDRAALDRYLAEHAERLRAEFLAHFPSGVGLTREIREVLQTWPAAGGQSRPSPT